MYHPIDGFEVYTYFGRRVAWYQIGENELHHRAAEAARVRCAETPNSWVRVTYARGQ